MQTNGFQHWIHFIIIISNIWIHFIKNIFKNEMDPVFWVLFFSEALGPIPNWILFRFPIFTFSKNWFFFQPTQAETSFTGTNADHFAKQLNELQTYPSNLKSCMLFF